MADDHEQDKPIPFVRQKTDVFVEALSRIREDLDAAEREHNRIMSFYERREQQT